MVEITDEETSVLLSHRYGILLRSKW